ncbi:hypothetical protein DUI87_16348 [Hirundo rustica rustica]|uniref:Uncharacterized protein n=1 Tax=Hirundo rustica rustica TaxID=333673 RepID=A0A3M0K1N9_HIRRU|nr:hypothetical protein DUI87_16348 [Hirundo rustica rustica]
MILLGPFQLNMSCDSMEFVKEKALNINIQLYSLVIMSKLKMCIHTENVLFNSQYSSVLSRLAGVQASSVLHCYYEILSGLQIVEGSKYSN